MNRRKFISSAATGMAAYLVFKDTEVAALETVSPVAAQGKHGASGLPSGLGTYYDASVPDTLDLAERASLAVNHFTSTICEEQDYEMYWRGRLAPRNLTGYKWHMSFKCHPLHACQPKTMEALAMARIMSGSKQNLEVEAAMVKMLVSHIGDEGVYWVPEYPEKSWFGPLEYRPHANVHGQARMMRAMFAWYQYTGDQTWKELIDRMVDGIDKHLVVQKNDYAYFPTRGWMDEEYFRSCYVKGKGWKDTTEPTDEKSGEEGSLFNHQGHTPGVLANWYMMTGNEQALRLSGELVRFLMKPKFWADWKGGEYPNVVGAEHAHWTGHWHGHINTLRAILEYAIATNNVQLKGFVRDGYEWARQSQLACIGLVGDSQGCATGRLIGLAIKLSDAGVGDYWEDVDRYIRNHGIEMQFTPEDIPYMQSLQAGKPDPPPDIDPGATAVGAVDAAIGGFSQQPFKLDWYGCCSPHGVMGLFYAWEGTLRYSGGVVRVNLFLNRASPWMDIDSYIPYEGKVVLKNKTAREAYVRIPLWVDARTVNCRVGDRAVRPEWFGRYVRLEHLRVGDVVTIEFPVQERVERWTTPETFRRDYPGWPGQAVHAFRFKGNTLVEISPPLPNWDPAHGDMWLYSSRAAKYRANNSPMTKATRFATPFVLKW